MPDVVLAGALAVAMAIAVMFALRCLHPPGGAMALSAVLVHASHGHFTDLGLRVLMYLSHQVRDTPVTISDAERFDVSRHHLVKVVHFMGQQGWLITTRGKGGGLALAFGLQHYRLGQVVRVLEG